MNVREVMEKITLLSKDIKCLEEVMDVLKSEHGTYYVPKRSKDQRNLIQRLLEDHIADRDELLGREVSSDLSYIRITDDQPKVVPYEVPFPPEEGTRIRCNTYVKNNKEDGGPDIHCTFDPPIQP